MVGLNSAAGLIGLLDEPDNQLKVFALKQLNQLVDQFWSELADHIAKMYAYFLTRDSEDSGLFASSC